MTGHAATLVVAAIALPAAVALAAPSEIISFVTPSGVSRLIGEHGRWDDTCRALDVPPVVLERPAAHGSICVRRDIITVSQTRSGRAANCVGRALNGIRVIYRPQPGFAGADTLRYGLQFPEAYLSREIAIDILGSEAVAPPLLGEISQDQQPLGRVPDCPGATS